MYSRMFSDIPGIYPLDVSSNPLVMTTRNVSRHYQMSSAGQNLSRLRTTAVGRCATCAGWVSARGTPVNTAQVRGTRDRVPKASGQVLTLEHS